MAHRLPRSARFDVPVPELKRLADGWLRDDEYRQLSARTLETRRDTVDYFLRWLNREGCSSCGPMDRRLHGLHDQRS